MREKQGYAVTTYRFRLYRKHPQWFHATKELYCQVADFYLSVIFRDRLEQLGDYELQRRIEVLTQGEKRKKLPPAEPLPCGRVPLYFRRAALREAAGVARSYCARAAGQKQRGLPLPEHLDTFPVYYKGMYRKLDLEQGRIELKLYTGSHWKWESFRFTTDGRRIPEGAVLLSPTIKTEKEQVYLHIPVKEPVSDVRTVKERAGEEYLSVMLPSRLGGEEGGGGEALCHAGRKPPAGETGAGFLAGTAEDVLAACVTGRSRHTLLVRGGRSFADRKERLRRASAEVPEGERKKRWQEHMREKERSLCRRQLHEVSRAVVDFAEKEGCKIIVVPDYRWPPEKSRGGGQAEWSERKLCDYIAYKSFQKGIVLCRIFSGGVGGACYLCGEPLQKQGALYACQNGHQGNYLLNAAGNLGKRYEKRYGNSQPPEA